MSISSQSLGLGTSEDSKLQDLLANANDVKRRQIERKMQRAVARALAEPDLAAANVKQKIATQLKLLIPEIAT